MSLDSFNSLPPEVLEKLLLSLAHSRKWAQQVALSRPFSTIAECLYAVETIFSSLSDAQICAAISHHPQIGELTSNRLSLQEQSNLNLNTYLRDDFRAANTRYEETFGFPYLVFATGKSGIELLHILNERMNNSIAEEMKIAKTELIAITLHRLHQFLLSEDFPITVSTHILDTFHGIPAADITVNLHSSYLNYEYSQKTDQQGRITSFGPLITALNSSFTATFHVASYYIAEMLTSQGKEHPFYPQISVQFLIADTTDHFHIPLLLSPYSYTTYRGS